MEHILEVVDAFKPEAVRVYGDGSVSLVGQTHRLLGFSLAQFGVALAARGYVKTTIGQGYCQMAVYHARQAA